MARRAARDAAGSPRRGRAAAMRCGAMQSRTPHVWMVRRMRGRRVRGAGAQGTGAGRRRAPYRRSAGRRRITEVCWCQERERGGGKTHVVNHDVRNVTCWFRLGNTGCGRSGRQLGGAAVGQPRAGGGQWGRRGGGSRRVRRPSEGGRGQWLGVGSPRSCPTKYGVWSIDRPPRAGAEQTRKARASHSAPVSVIPSRHQIGAPAVARG